MSEQDILYCVKLKDVSSDTEVATELISAMDFQYSSWFDYQEKIGFHTLYFSSELEADEAMEEGEAMVEEVEEEGSSSSRLTFGNLVVDSSMREAWLEGESIDLTSAEFDLLWLLSSNAGRVLTREEIFNQLRGIEYDGQDRSIDVRVSRIRPKVGDDPMNPKRIKTVRSKGYLFVKEL